MDMVARDLPFENLQFLFHRHLALQGADAEGDRSHKDRFAVFRGPDKVGLGV